MKVLKLGKILLDQVSLSSDQIKISLCQQSFIVSMIIVAPTF